jgi:hypothetical protein
MKLATGGTLQPEPGLYGRIAAPTLDLDAVLFHVDVGIDGEARGPSRGDGYCRESSYRLAGVEPGCFSSLNFPYASLMTDKPLHSPTSVLPLMDKVMYAGSGDRASFEEHGTGRMISNVHE